MLTYVQAADGLFADLTLLLRHPMLRRAMLGLLSQLDALAPEAVRQVMQHPEFQHPHGLHLNLSAFKGVLKIVRRVLSALWSRDLTGFVDQTNSLMDEYIRGGDPLSGSASAGQGQLQTVLDTLPDFFPFFLNWVPEAGAGLPPPGS